MKKTAFLIVLSIICAVSCVIYIPRTSDRHPSADEGYYEEVHPVASPTVDMSFFYDYLSRYGVWTHHPTFAYIWVPHTTRYGWRPYTYGHWVWTDYGWTWISYFNWGWVPFHYGRWGWDRYLGWFWAPDSVWGPAWVTWRWGDLHVGWAPLPPEAVFVTGVGINSVPYALPHMYWVFIETPYFLDTRIYRYVLPVERNITIINYTVLRTNIYVHNERIINRGIHTDDLRRIVKRSISKYELKDMSEPGQTKVRMNDVQVYRPTVIRKEEMRPKEVLEQEDVQQRREKKSLERQEEAFTIDEREEDLEKIHEREMRLLERSQIREIKEADKKLQRMRKSVQSSSEEKEVEKKLRKEVEEIEESHKKERISLQERHKKEEEEAKKKIRRKETP